MGKKFDRLAEHVSREYEAKGIPKEEAEEWGRATAAKVAREKHPDGYKHEDGHKGEGTHE